MTATDARGGMPGAGPGGMPGGFPGGTPPGGGYGMPGAPPLRLDALRRAVPAGTPTPPAAQ